MSILWAEGFDHYGDDETMMLDGPYAAVSGSTLTTAKARTGLRSLLTGSANGNGFRRVWGAAKSTVGIGAAFWHDALPSNNFSRMLFDFRDNANNNQVRLWLLSTGAIQARADPFDGVTLGTSTALVTANAWNHIEAKVHIDSSAGTVEVRLNGVTVLNLTGVNTNHTATGETSQVFSGSLSTYFDSVYMDDMVAWDTDGASNNDFIGDRKVFTDFPDADTADVDWTPNSGSNRWSRISENPPDGDTSYDSSASAGDKMGVTFPDLDAQVTSVTAVILLHKSKKTDAGDCNVQLHAISGADTADGTDRPMTTAYSLYQDVFEVDPATSAPWTNGGASAVAMQVERTL